MRHHRVVAADPAALAARARLLAAGARAVIGIAGAPGAGKSTIAAELAAQVPRSVVVPMDGFHLSTAELDRLHRVERRGAPDTFDAAGFVTLLAELHTRSDELTAPDFDRSIEEPVPAAIRIPASTELVIVEGNYLLLEIPPWSQAADHLDQVWYVEVPEQVRIDRLIARFVAFGMDADQARERVLHGSDARNAALVAGTRSRADLIVTAPTGLS
jgi:pantothenate kinase